MCEARIPSARVRCALAPSGFDISGSRAAVLRAAGSRRGNRSLHCISRSGAAMKPACSPDSRVAGQYWPVPENKSKAANAPFRGRCRDHALAVAKLPYAILLHMVKIAQTLSAWRWMMDPAVARRNEEETDLRVRICDSTEAASVPTGRAKSPPVSRLAYEGVPQSPAGLPLAGQISLTTASENLA
jgi:hypothetical protein